MAVCCVIVTIAPAFFIITPSSAAASSVHTHSHLYDGDGSTWFIGVFLHIPPFSFMHFFFVHWFDVLKICIRSTHTHQHFSHFFNYEIAWNRYIKHGIDHAHTNTRVFVSIVYSFRFQYHFIFSSLLPIFFLLSKDARWGAHTICMRAHTFGHLHFSNKNECVPLSRIYFMRQQAYFYFIKKKCIGRVHLSAKKKMEKDDDEKKNLGRMAMK